MWRISAWRLSMRLAANIRRLILSTPAAPRLRFTALKASHRRSISILPDEGVCLLGHHVIPVVCTTSRPVAGGGGSVCLAEGRLRREEARLGPNAA